MVGNTGIPPPPHPPYDPLGNGLAESFSKLGCLLGNSLVPLPHLSQICLHFNIPKHHPHPPKHTPMSAPQPTSPHLSTHIEILMGVVPY